MTKTKGFTLIELLVVIAIIGILSSVVLASLNTARAKARDTQRLSDMHQLVIALSIYYNQNGTYPSTGSSVSWRSACPTYGGYVATTGANAWIPNIAPAFIPTVPFDPKPGPAGYQCYLYTSDGTNYMLLAYYSAETFTSGTNRWTRAIDPNPATLAFYTPGAANW